jgi:hypothetical protein
MASNASPVLCTSLGTTVPPGTNAPEWHVPLELSPVPDKGSEKGLWVNPVAFVHLLNGWALAQ